MIRLPQAAQARLDALENDNNQADEAFGLASDDDEFTLEDEDDDDGMSRTTTDGQPLHNTSSVCRLPAYTSCLCSCVCTEVGGKKGKGRKKAGTKRKLRSGAADRRGPKSFARLLDDVGWLGGRVQGTTGQPLATRRATSRTQLLSVAIRLEVCPNARLTPLYTQAEVDRVPPGKSTYVTACARPSKCGAPRVYCSVCGNIST